MEIHCLKCKKKTDTLDPHPELTKNHRWTIKGTCAECSSKKSRIISDAQAQELELEIPDRPKRLRPQTVNVGGATKAPRKPRKKALVEAELDVPVQVVKVGSATKAPRKSRKKAQVVEQVADQPLDDETASELLIKSLVLD